MTPAHYGGLLAAAFIAPHLPSELAMCLGAGVLFWFFWVSER